MLRCFVVLLYIHARGALYGAENGGGGASGVVTCVHLDPGDSREPGESAGSTHKAVSFRGNPETTHSGSLLVAREICSYVPSLDKGSVVFSVHTISAFRNTGALNRQFNPRYSRPLSVGLLLSCLSWLLRSVLVASCLKMGPGRDEDAERRRELSGGSGRDGPRAGVEQERVRGAGEELNYTTQRTL